MTIKTMRIFAEVCKNESITLAAKVMGTSQPSVSTAIKELESQYGVKLFDRLSNRLYITEAGRQMYRQVSDILMKIDELSSIKANEVQRTSLRVGICPLFAPYPFPQILAKFNNENPDIEVLTYIYNADRLEQMLLDNDLDIIFSVYVTSERLKKVEIAADEMVFLCSKEYRKKLPQNPSLADLSDQKFITLDTGVKKFEFLNESIQGGGRTIMKSLDGTPLIFSAINGLGLYCVPRKQAEWLVSMFPNKADYIIPNTSPLITFSYAHHTQKLIDSTLDSFIKTVEEVCRESFK